MKVKIGDNVLVIAGKNKGAKGKVMRVFKKTDKIVVEKVNMRKKHIKKTSSKPGEIITYEASIHVSNVKVMCAKCKKDVRVGYVILESGKKQRICKKCNEPLDTPSSKS